MFSSDQPLVANQLPISVDFPRDKEEFIDTITLLYKRIASSVNTKEGALYLPQELATFQQYFTVDNPQKLRAVYRKTFDMVDLNGGPIPTGATVSFPHNITGIMACTRIYGSATNTSSDFLPLPFASENTTLIIEIKLTPTNVILINGSAMPPLTHATIVAEYVKNN